MEKYKSGRSGRIISLPLEIILRLFGIWPGAPFNPLFKTFWLIVTTFNMISQYLFLILHVGSIEFTVFIYGVSACLAFTVKYFKLITFWLNQRKFDDIWRTMSINWRPSDTKPNAAATVSNTNRLHYLPNAIVAYNVVSVSTSTFGNLVSGIHYDETSNASRPFLNMMELPFDISTQSTYLVVIFGQFFNLLLISSGTMTINAVLIVMMLYLGDQIDIIRRCLTEISPERDVGLIIVKDIIRKHQRVIAFSEEIESFYTYIALILIVLNTLITCGLGFLLVTAIRSPNCTQIVMKNLMFYCGMNMESLVYCFAGEYISTKSKEIGEAAYNSPWYRSKSHSRIILLLIIRSQNQLTFTMGKFMDLSLEQFASIVKASGSYVSVLLAMY